MVRTRIAVACIVSCLFGASGSHGATLYVTPSGNGSENCSSWANSCMLPDAISAAESGDHIWVKAGTYAPFSLKNGVKIIGGFAGTETAASQSNPATNATIVDGDGAYQCITSTGDGPTTLLRGFTIRKCAINGTDTIGAGILLEESGAKVVQCIFENNAAQYFGAGAAVKGTGSPHFVNCVFRNNGSGLLKSATPYGGGGVYVESDSPKFTNCLFYNNKAGEGGAVLIRSGTPTFINCTFNGNSAQFGSGGALFDQAGAASIHNSILWNNTAHRHGSHVYNSAGSTTTITYSNIQGGWTGTGNIDSDPLFIGDWMGNFKIPVGSPCKDTGSNALLPADVADLDWDNNTTETLPHDLAGQYRSIQGNVDMGAYEGPFYQGEID